jgi:hypothetical protein
MHVFDVVEQANPGLQAKMRHGDPRLPVGAITHVPSSPQTSPGPHPPTVPLKHGPPGEATASQVPHDSVAMPPSSSGRSPVQTLLAH